MSLYTALKPSSVIWSKLPIRFRIGFTDVNPTYQIQVQLIRQAGSLVLADVSYPVSSYASSLDDDTTPIDGYVDVVVEKLLDPNLIYQLPVDPGVLPGDGTVVNRLTLNNNIFYIQYRLTGISLEEQPWTVDSFLYRVVKGGLGSMNFIDEYNNNNQNGSFTLSKFSPKGSCFLTLVPSGRLMAADEWGWLLYFSNSSSLSQSVKYQVNYKDGTVSVITKSFPATTLTSLIHEMYFIPMGVSQCSLDPANKGVVSYTIQVFVSALLQDSYTINVDTRPWYKTITVYYRNSMGGIDHYKFRGKIELSIDTDKGEAEQSRWMPANNSGPDYFFDSKATLSFKANTGYIPLKQMLALSELLNTTYAAILVGGTKWLQLRVPTQKFTFLDTQNNLYNEAIQFEAAGSFRSIPPEFLDILDNI